MTARDRYAVSSISGRLFGASVDCFLQDHPSQPSDGTICAARTGLSAGCQQCFDALVQCVMVETLCFQTCLAGIQPGGSYTTPPECELCMRDVGCVAVLDDCAGTDASVDAAAQSNSGLCVAGTVDINRACPLDESLARAAETGVPSATLGAVPTTCTEECAAVFVPWWDQCVASAVGLEVELQLGREQLTGFYRACLEAGAAETTDGVATSSPSTGH